MKTETQCSKMQSIVFYLSFLIGTAFSFYLVVNSHGAYLDDEIGHFVIARDAWKDPRLLLSDWGRVGTTAVFMLPATLFGLTGTRICALLLLCISLALTAKIAKSIGVKFWYLLPILFWFQPWIAKWGAACLTETPLLFVWTLAAFLLDKKRFYWSAMLFGSLPLIRHETIIISGLAACYYLWQRNFLALLLTALPTALLNLVAKLWMGYLPFYSTYLRPHRTKMYGEGEWLHFLEPLAENAGPVIVLLFILGLLLTFKQQRLALFCIPFFAYIATHTIIYRFGLYASGGFSIFLLPIAPMLALVAALGIELINKLIMRTSELLKHSHAAALHSIVNFILMLAIIYSCNSVKPQKMRGEQALMQQVANWLKQQELETSSVISTHVWLYYYLGLVPNHPQSLWIPRKLPKDLRENTIVVWDNHYSERWGYNKAKLIENPEKWQVLKDFGGAMVFRKKAA